MTSSADQPTPTPTNPTDDMVPVENVNQFAAYVAHWFGNRQAQLRHLLTVPEGTTFTIGEGAEEQALELSGTSLAAFKFGVEMAIMQLGQLPFAVEHDVDPGTPALGKHDAPGG